MTQTKPRPEVARFLRAGEQARKELAELAGRGSRLTATERALIADSAARTIKALAPFAARSDDTES